MFYIEFAKLPEVGQTLHISTSLSGKTRHDLYHVGNGQFAMLVNDHARGTFTVPSKSRNGVPAERCQVVIHEAGRGFDCYLVPNPDTYRCPLRRLMAEKRISQKALIYADEYAVSYSWDSGIGYEGSADTRNGEDHYSTDDWHHEHADEYDTLTDNAVAYSSKYYGGTAAVVVDVIGRDTCYHRAERIKKIIIAPGKKEAAMDFLITKICEL